MAFSSVLLERFRDGDKIREIYSWDGTGVTTSGTFTPQTTDNNGIGLMRVIDSVSLCDDSNAVRWKYVSNTARTSVNLTFTSGDTGVIVLTGRA